MKQLPCTNQAHLHKKQLPNHPDQLAILFQLRKSLQSVLTLSIFILFPHWVLSQKNQKMSQSIGFYNNGCIQNAVSLPAQGPGYQVLHFMKQRSFGHPILIKYVQELGKNIQTIWNPTPKKKKKKKKIGFPTKWVLGIDDLSLEFGGPIPGPHHSHQNGLDVDISFSPINPQTFSSENTTPSIYMVDLQNRQMTPYWGHQQILLLKQAVKSPFVDRIFVNPSIKRVLCQMKKPNDPEETWIRKIRPWYGHAAHFHVRLKCPPNSSHFCRSQPTLPKGDGCGPELARWFLPQTPKKADDSKEEKSPSPPIACQEIWAQHHVHIPTTETASSQIDKQGSTMTAQPNQTSLEKDTNKEGL